MTNKNKKKRKETERPMAYLYEDEVFDVNYVTYDGRYTFVNGEPRLLFDVHHISFWVEVYDKITKINISEGVIRVALADGVAGWVEWDDLRQIDKLNVRLKENIKTK